MPYYAWTALNIKTVNLVCSEIQAGGLCSAGVTHNLPLSFVAALVFGVRHPDVSDSLDCF